MDLTKLFGIRELVPGMRLQAACGCHQGKRRTNNEDNFYFDGSYMSSDNHGISEPEAKEISLNDDSFFCVFDGMGGGDFGEVASYTAAKTAKDFLDIKTNINPCDITPSMEKLCQTVNEAVVAAGQKLGSSQMGSTLVGLYFHERQAWVCNLGDSRCYLLRNGKMRRISEDHTDEEFMKENGITGRKPYLTQYLGIDPEEMEIVPSVRSYYLDKGDRFLICSDGVTDMVSEQQICHLLAGSGYADERVKQLIQAALDGGGKDNITAIVLDIV
ncbi:MAG: serine/threonine-protein phosphatase [Clostridiales bacterium]|nr:serine/threonine-protein phosphatase [Clostridiales bacterium]